MRVMVLHAHPVETSFNRALCNAVLETLKAKGHEPDLVDLYAEFFQLFKVIFEVAVPDVRRKLVGNMLRVPDGCEVLRRLRKVIH